MVSAAVASPQDTGNLQSRNILLTVPATVLLRLYLTKRVPKRSGALVEAKLLTPVYAFDHEAIPAGTQVLGYVSSIQSVSRAEPTSAVLGGDFTPLHIAQIEFTSLTLPDGHFMQFHTRESPGLRTLVPLLKPQQPAPNQPGKKSSPANGGIL